ncbi:MAG: acetyl-CoA carboxylase biotin carboxyl carrier protein [Schleiferiaceae bacterium]|jgi:acetyl-CoA carboxylase biotin carboxyl carrier protein|nr:acetyl-CoA carboxylase biotin carboxyl carrier protein [Schleiferiaceae bacterium]MDP4626610.1 acetyl-CoA carboxylase biotin carboxyl carrier protein [Schleiferiaceae bacterium]MDP4728249.1 acetyl-CoA carboxylase biotin carboxyl carrier protein [Schleiferiaceae bacterium]MDP4749051.1 acetyl-CoA carboxylase biotin carboxyl carrier protein [Schleiferiaceae bacterium]MDP4859973.1 acetyl-CoA carboxylase biotin carboxyl carrier protein [Schleiferiaceae bacterium]
MDIKELQNFIRFVSKSGATEVSLETDEFKITVKTAPGAQDFAFVPSAPMTMPSAAYAPAPVAAPASAPVSETPAGEDTSKYITVKSPMIGTFYRRPSPDKDFFVNVGDEIKPGKAVCVIEAMKLFNEIESEVSGRIVKILVDDSSPVEYDQPLFLVDPA